MENFPLDMEYVPSDTEGVLLDRNGSPLEVGSVLLEGESGRGDLGDGRSEEYYRPRDMFLVLDVRIAQ